ncbi:hypothetical protein COOONC_27449, partial [Cooperia oncophora]
MGEVGEISDEVVVQETTSNQDIPTASGSGMASVERIDLVTHGVHDWNGLRNNLARSGSNTVEPSSSGVPRRYAYAYQSRFRYPSPEIIPKIEPQDLLEIAGSTAQTFKDINAAMKKREDAKNAYKKSRKSSSAVEPPAPVEKQTSAKKRGRERDEKSQSKESSLSQKAAKEKEKTKSPERKENGGRSSSRTSTKRSVSSSPEPPSRVHDDEQRSSKKRKEKSASTKSTSTNIKGWTYEQIFKHFNLREFTIDISDFPHHELQASTSSQEAVVPP